MKQSPPIPVLSGSTTHCMATAAIAASAALPPDRSTSRAASVAIGCEVAAIPFAAIAADRPGTLKSRIQSCLAKGTAARATGAILTGRLPACRGLMHRPNLPVNSPPEKSMTNGRKLDTVAVSGCGAARTGGDARNCPRDPVAAHAAPFRARSHQSLAARRRRGLDDRRYRLRDGGNKGAVGADLRRAAQRFTGYAGDCHPLPPRPYRARRLADRALAGTLVGQRKRMAVCPRDEPG